MPNVMAAQPNIGDAICKSSVIPFLAPSRISLMPAAGVHCSNTANVKERRLRRKMTFAPGKTPALTLLIW